MCDRVNPRRLMLARHDNPRASMSVQILQHRRDACISTAGEQRRGECFYLRSPHAETMLGHRSRNTWCSFRDVKTRRFRVCVRGSRPAPPGIVASVTNAARHSRTQKISVQRNDHVRLIELVNRIQRFAERGHRSRARRVPPARLILMPFRLRKGSCKVLELAAQRRRSNRARQDSQAGPLFRSRCIARIDQRRLKIVPSTEVSVTRHDL